MVPLILDKAADDKRLRALPPLDYILLRAVFCDHSFPSNYQDRDIIQHPTTTSLRYISWFLNPDDFSIRSIPPHLRAKPVVFHRKAAICGPLMARLVRTVLVAAWAQKQRPRAIAEFKIVSAAIYATVGGWIDRASGANRGSARRHFSFLLWYKRSNGWMLPMITEKYQGGLAAKSKSDQESACDVLEQTHQDCFRGSSASINKGPFQIRAVHGSTWWCVAQHFPN